MILFSKHKDSNNFNISNKIEKKVFFLSTDWARYWNCKGLKPRPCKVCRQAAVDFLLCSASREIHFFP
jgi:hypothetical protein